LVSRGRYELGTVERVLITREDFVEYAVFALRDEKFGEAVRAAIVLESNKKALLFANTNDHQAIDSGAVEEEEQWMKRIRKYCA
jgi:acyl-coenzyme A synthetase/AMP-(fatty) acid ligase